MLGVHWWSKKRCGALWVAVSLFSSDVVNLLYSTEKDDSKNMDNQDGQEWVVYPI